MDIGIGLPNTIPGVPGGLIPRWARRAEERGFATLATVDRIVYSNIEALLALAAAAAVTERISLFTDILLAPTRQPTILAKQAASLDVLSGGRLTLGLAPGGREEDYTATGLAFGNRGRRFDAMLALLQRTWAGEPLAGTSRPLGPRPLHADIPILVGGASPATIRRVARFGAGWTAGSGAAGRLPELVKQVRTAWADAGREGSPRISTLTYFGMGQSLDAAGAYLTDYYGPERGAQVLQAMVRTPSDLQRFLDSARAAGVGEVVLFPAVGDLAQVDRLADALPS